MSEDRIIELETRLAEQERTLQEISDVLVHQEKLIERLTARLTASDDRITELEAGLPVPANEKPPHY